MPKKSRRTARNATSQWSPQQRVAHNLEEIAVYLTAAGFALEDLEGHFYDDANFLKEMKKHRKQLGLRLKVMYKTLTDAFDELPKQPKS